VPRGNRSSWLSPGKYGIRIIGPNCLGIIDSFCAHERVLCGGTPKSGSIAFMSQSGALCTAILDYALAETIGFSHFVSLGNKSDVDEVALLEAWSDDDRTNVIIAYIEGLRDGAQFHPPGTPDGPQNAIIAVKSGRTSLRFARRVLSHWQFGRCGRGLQCRVQQAGVLRADTVEELFDFSTAFAYQPLLKGNRIAIVTNAGGPASWPPMRSSSMV
jgi:acetyltransferase